MEPKEKADKLIEKYDSLQSAIIAVIEILEFMKQYDEDDGGCHMANSKWTAYYLKVKKELERQ